MKSHGQISFLIGGTVTIDGIVYNFLQTINGHKVGEDTIEIGEINTQLKLASGTADYLAKTDPVYGKMTNTQLGTVGQIGLNYSVDEIKTNFSGLTFISNATLNQIEAGAATDITPA